MSSFSRLAVPYSRQDVDTCGSITFQLRMSWRRSPSVPNGSVDSLVRPATTEPATDDDGAARRGRVLVVARRSQGMRQWLFTRPSTTHVGRRSLISRLTSLAGQAAAAAAENFMSTNGRNDGITQHPQPGSSARVRRQLLTVSIDRPMISSHQSTPPITPTRPPSYSTLCICPIVTSVRQAGSPCRDTSKNDVDDEHD